MCNSYVNLSLKWRPKYFNDFIGHENIIKVLKNILLYKKIHNCYLFYGFHGVGKTSLARILSKSLNCVKGITEFFCGKCVNCISIDSNKSSDVIEIDAASRTKIEDIKELLDKIYYLPISMRYKIYIIDEVHMLSRYSFNYLLKILEEPPKHVKFILATTEINKIPDTILSRCMLFHLKSLTKSNIFNRIKYILYNEKIILDKDIINIISIRSNGSMRDALMFLDQLLILKKNNKIYLSDVYLILDIIDDKKIYLFIKYLFLKNKKIFFLLNKFNKLNINYDNLLDSLINKLHNLLLLILFPKYLIFLKKKSFHFLKFIKFLNLISLKDIKFYYKLFLLSKKNMFLSYNKNIIFEYYILRGFMYKNNFY